MNRKIMLLALAAVSAALLALPAMAAATPTTLHLKPTPSGAQTVDGNGEAFLTTTGGTKVTCSKFHGTATFEEGGTTGTMQLTFGPTCTVGLGIHCTSTGEATGAITTTVLPFHLVTVGNPSPGKPGVLVTPGEGNHFATFTCFGVKTEVTGNGVLGTITKPKCGEAGKEATVVFGTSGNGVQEHKFLTDTPETEYTLKKGGENAAQNAHGTLTLSSESTLECT